MERSDGLVLAAVVLAIGGCGKAGYDRDYDARLAEYRKEAALAPLDRQRSTFVGARLGLRLPVGFTQVPEREAGEGDAPAGPPIDPTRLRPSFLDAFPGFAAAFERPAEAGQVRLRELLTLGLVPAADRKFGEVESEILERARREEGFQESFQKQDARPAWQSVAVEPAAGGPAAWRRLELRGGQMVETEKDGQVEFGRRPGVCEIWLSAEPDQEFCTVLAWRTVDGAVVAGTPLPALVSLLPRTVGILPAPAAGDEEPPSK